MTAREICRKADLCYTKEEDFREMVDRHVEKFNIDHQNGITMYALKASAAQ